MPDADQATTSGHYVTLIRRSIFGPDAGESLCGQYIQLILNY